MKISSHDKNERAPITNVALAIETLGRSIDRRASLPGLVGFYGPSGYGKSVAALQTAIHYDAYYLECRSTWTQKSLLKNLAQTLGIPAIGTIDDLRERVEEQLLLSRKPLLLDEADYLIQKNLIALVRDIHDSTKAPIMLIGEEQMPMKLKRVERVHGRFLCWTPAQPASLDDTRLLADMYAQGCNIANELLERVHHLAQGSVRRICVNLDHIREEAALNGWKKVDLATWAKRELFTGEAPARRLV